MATKAQFTQSSARRIAAVVRQVEGQALALNQPMRPTYRPTMASPHFAYASTATEITVGGGRGLTGRYPESIWIYRAGASVRIDCATPDVITGIAASGWIVYQVARNGSSTAFAYSAVFVADLTTLTDETYWWIPVCQIVWTTSAITAMYQVLWQDPIIVPSIWLNVVTDLQIDGLGALQAVTTRICVLETGAISGFTTTPLGFLTILLLHFEGTDAGTTFTDDSLYVQTVTPTNAETDTAQFKVEASSGLFQATGVLTVAHDTAIWTIGTGDFCVEAWVRLATLPAATKSMYVFAKGSTSGIIVAPSADGGGSTFLDVYVGGSNYQPAFTFVTGVWTHLCVNRASGVVQVFINGSQLGTSAANTTDVDTTGDALVGDDGAGGAPLDGWIDELRVSRTSRHTSDFTPSTTPFTAD